MVSFSLVSPTGDVLPLGTSGARDGDYGFLSGSAGLGLVPRDVKLTTSSGDGGRLRAVRVAPREATLIVLVHGRDEAQRAANLRRLSAAIRSVIDLPMPRLVATMANGLAYELPLVYTAGGENLEPVGGAGSYEVPLEVVFPDPFWTATEAETFAIAPNDTGDGLLPNLAALKITPSSAQGSLSVINSGDVASPAVWRITGPASLVSAASRGRGWSLATVAAGEVIIIDSTRNTVTLADGTNVYNRLGPAPKFFAVPAGRSFIEVALLGGSPGTWEQTGTEARRNLVHNPAGASTALLDGQLGWSARWFGPSTAGTSLEVSGAVDGPVGLTTYRRKRWDANAPGNGDTGFDLARATGIGGTDLRGFPVTPGDTLTMSAYLRPTSLGSKTGALSFVTRNSAGGYLGHINDVPVALALGAWNRLSYTYTVPSNVATISPILDVDGGAAWALGDTLDGTGFMLEKSSTLRDYLDGNSIDGANGIYSWTSTAHASPSVLYPSTLVGQSRIDAYYKPRLEVIL